MEDCAQRTEHSSDSRRYPRAASQAPVEILFDRWPKQRRLPARITDASSTGVRLRMERSDQDFFNGRAIVRWDVPAGMIHDGRTARVAMSGALVPHAGSACCGFRFDRLLEEELARRAARPRKLLAAAAAVLLTGLICLLKPRNLVSFWYGPFWQCYSLLASAYILSRVVFSTFYKEPEDRGVVKTISVVVPVKNEEKHIAQVVRRCLAARYPADKMELIVVDDGSTDKTWAVLEGLAPRYRRLRIHRFRKNKGKRHAMALGARKATGEILIYMDSDSLIEPEAFYRIVQPFHDDRVGAVAGHTLIIVEPGNMISKIEAVRYYVSFRVMKAAESVFGAVTCCPGPFSAYRRQAVIDVLESWLHQTFLGTRATFGDDRSLTNYILRNYRVIYHAGARVNTYAPGNWPTFLRQQLRWKKSWVRETTIAARRMWREHPMAALPYYLSIIVTLASPLAVLRVFVYAPLALGSAACLNYFLGLMLVFLLLGVVYYYHTQCRYWYYGLVFAVVYSWIFSLQTYYAMLTVRRNHWGTR